MAGKCPNTATDWTAGMKTVTKLCIHVFKIEKLKLIFASEDQYRAL